MEDAELSAEPENDAEDENAAELEGVIEIIEDIEVFDVEVGEPVKTPEAVPQSVRVIVAVEDGERADDIEGMFDAEDDGVADSEREKSALVLRALVIETVAVAAAD
jgi:hypothetical protein